MPHDSHSPQLLSSHINMNAIHSVSTLGGPLTTGSIIVILVVLKLLYTRYHGPLSAVPGPFSASFSNYWRVMAVYKSDMPKRIMAVHNKYGPVVRIGPKHVSFASAEALVTIHGSRDAYPKVRSILGNNFCTNNNNPVRLLQADYCDFGGRATSKLVRGSRCGLAFVFEEDNWSLVHQISGIRAGATD